MSQQHIPFEIQSEIMKRLPVKSLLRFRSVSKSYKSLIHSSDFIANYTSQHQHLLIRYSDGYKYYVSVVDDGETFPTQRVSLTLPELVACGYVIGSSHGLICFDSTPCPYRPWVDDEPTSETGSLLIFNPCIRKTLAFDVPRVEYGYTRESPYSNNFPSKYIYICRVPVVVDGCLYWLASDRRYWWYHLIISFDMTSEEFNEVNFPDSLARGYDIFFLYKLGESLALVKEGFENHKLVYDVWMMVDDDPKWFKMLYTISSHSPDVSILRLRGFRKTCEPIIEVTLRNDSTDMLASYDPYSKSMTNVGIDVRQLSNSMYSYTETLLLL